MRFLMTRERVATEREPDLDRLQRAYRLLKTDPHQALRELGELAKMGSPMSLVYIGIAHEKGIGTLPNFAEAERWLQRAEREGSDHGLIALGRLYLDAHDFASAEQVFKRGVAKDFLPASYWLAMVYLSDKSNRLTEARRLLERASNAGHVYAKRDLALLLMKRRFGLTGVLRGTWLYFGAIKDGAIVASKDPSSDRLV
jgi:TPR repeat protein